VSRRLIGRRINDLADILITNLPPIEDDLERVASSLSVMTRCASDNSRSADRKSSGIGT
jgi:hypothetical protein